MVLRKSYGRRWCNTNRLVQTYKKVKDDARLQGKGQPERAAPKAKGRKQPKEKQAEPEKKAP
eukprot:14776434-Alexandrium_andersonii.AAC.1